MGRNVVLIGVGQSGCSVADLSSHRMQDGDVSLTALALDTDERTLESVSHAVAIPMVDAGDLYSVVQALGAENIRGWFPCDWSADQTDFVKTLSMNQGANQWRMKAFLSFASFLSKPQTVAPLHEALDEAVRAAGDGGSVELYVAASLAGGTGSGLFLPVALYAKKYIESIGGTLSASTAMLTMPDMYESCYTAEQRVKSYANMYAALREYNAVLQCTHGSSAAGNGEKHPPVSFSLGVENGTPELLFDTEKSEYQTPSASPFTRAYLFERVPTVVNVSTHLELVSDIFLSLCHRGALPTETDDDQDAVFGGINLTKVTYPVERIVNYIGKKQTLDCVDRELSFALSRVKAEMLRRQKEAHLYGYVYVEDAGSYCDTYIALCEDLLKDSDSALALIGRDAETFGEDRSADGVWELEHDERLLSAVDDSLDCDSARELSALLYPPATHKAPDDGKKRKKKKEKPVKRTKEDVLANARRCGALVRRYYQDSLRLVRQPETFAAALQSADATDGGFSLVRDVICPGGVSLHPVYALLRLCYTYRKVQETHGYLQSGIPLSDEGNELPELLTNADPDMIFKTKYSRLGEERFRTLALDEQMPSPKLADDESLFLHDLEYVYLRMRRHFRAARFSVALAVLETWIARYRRLLDVMCGLSDELGDDVKLLERSGSSHLTAVNVGVSSAEKQAAYDAYTANYYKDPSTVAAYTTLLGDRVLRALQMYDGESSLRDTAVSVLADLEAHFSAQCRDSAFYGAKLDKNVLEAALEACANPATGTTLSKVFRGRTMPLHVTMPDSYREYRSVRRSTEAILSRGVETELARDPEKFPASSPQNFVERLMYTAGEYSGQASFAAFVPNDEMRLQSSVERLRLYFVNAVSETGEDCRGYRCYRSAVDYRDRHATRMWDPHVVYAREGELCLPYINPILQKQYEGDVAKAVLCALSRGGLTTVDVDGTGETAYAICTKDGFETILLGGDVVKTDNPRRLMRWATCHGEWVSQYAAEYERLETEGLRHIPTQGRADWDDAEIRRAVSQAELLELLREHALVMIADLLADESDVDGGYALRTASVASETLLKFCARGFGDRREAGYTVLVNKQLARWVDALSAARGADAVSHTLEWLSEYGVLTPSALPDDL